jgi:hypothetical protein
MDTQRVLREFDRFFAAWTREHDWGEAAIEAARERVFYDWLDPRVPFDHPDRDAILAAWQAREAERAAAQDAEWQRREEARVAAEREQTATEARATTERERATAAARAAAERERTERAAAERAVLVDRVTDRAWVHGEDPASLRAVAAWRRTMAGVAFRVADGPARDALGTAARALDVEVAERATAIGAAQRHAQAEPPILRQARGLPPVAIPAPFDVGTAVDPDAVGRWLVAHVGTYTLTVGAHADVERPDGEGTRRVLQRPAEWAPIVERCARWAVYARIAALATANPDAAPVLREKAIRALVAPWLDREAWLHREPGDAALIAELDAERPRWEFAPADEPTPDAAEAPEPRTEAQGGRRKALDPERLRDRVRRSVRRFHREHKRGPSKKEIRDNVTGRDETIIATIDEMVADGEMEVRTYGGQPGYAIADE